MAIYRRKKSGIWYINICYKGQRIFKSTGTKDKDAAQRYHNQIERDLWEQERLGKKPKRSWQDAVTRWVSEMAHKKSLSDDQIILNWLDPYLSTYLLDKITRDVIEEIAHAKENEKRGKEKKSISPARVNRVLALIRSILRKAEREWEWIDKSPSVRMRKEPKGRVRWLTPQEVDKLITALPDHLKAMCWFSIATGRRKSEVINLKWKSVDLKGQHAWVDAGETKSGYAASIPLNEMAMAILESQIGKHAEYVFTYKGNPVSECNTKAWRKALKRAGIENFRWHDLRHTFASWHVQNGTTLQQLKELGSWRSLTMVLRYAHLGNENLKGAAGNIDSNRGTDVNVSQTTKDE